MKALLGICVLLAGALFTEANAKETRFWGNYKVLRCGEAQVSSAQAYEDRTTQLRIRNVVSYECTWGDQVYELNLDVWTVGFKLVGPDSSNRVIVECQDSNFEGDYKLFSLTAGIGYSLSYGQAKNENHARDCQLTVLGDELLGGGVDVGGFAVTRIL